MDMIQFLMYQIGENMSPDPSYYNYEKTNTFGDMRFVFV